MLLEIRIRNPDPDKDTYPDLDQIRIRIATLVRRALAEVCTVPVLLVIILTVTRFTVI